MHAFAKLRMYTVIKHSPYVGYSVIVGNLRLLRLSLIFVFTLAYNYFNSCKPEQRAKTTRAVRYEAYMPS